MENSGFNLNGRARVAAAGALVLLLAGCAQSPVSVDASALRLSAQVIPREIAASVASATDSVRVEITLTNPQARAVVVDLGGPPHTSGQIPAAETHGIGFGVRLLAADSAARARGAGPSEWTFGQPKVVLGARATLHHTFIVRVATQPMGGLSITPGTYSVVASFGQQEAAPIELHVLP